MAKRSIELTPSASSGATSTPRLGTVMRFQPKAGGAGIKQLEASGFRIASSREFHAASAIPNDFGGADVQYFERFGIAIVRRDSERLAPALNRAFEQKTVSAARPEIAYHALGTLASTRQDAEDEPEAADDAPDANRAYLTGYRDGVNQLVDRLLGSNEVGTSRSRLIRFDETALTWGLQAIGVPLSGLTGAGIKVAVLDTGFDETHPDFRGRAVTKKRFASNSTDGDVIGHGTHCIGTACGPLRPSSVPRYGVAHEAAIFAGKVLGDDGFGTDRSVIAGMDWALEQGCHIISMSLGAVTKVGDQANDDYEQIGQVCLDAGAIVIAAAGNESARPGRINPVGSPANASTIMAVGAINRRLRPAPFSCGGLNSGQEVDIAAPGADILSCLPGGQYARWDGTSMATPHVSGVAALLAQSDPTFRGWALWARLLQLVRPLPFLSRDVGKGLVQAPKK